MFPSVLLTVRVYYSYLETNGEDSIVRPWFWITWILVGPVLRCLSGEWFVYTAVRFSLLLHLLPCPYMSSFLRRTVLKYKPRDYSLNLCSSIPSEFASRRRCLVFLPMNPLSKTHLPVVRSLNRPRHPRATIWLGKSTTLSRTIWKR